MTARFPEAFQAHAGEDLPGLIPYVTAGFPRLDATAELLLAAEQGGALAAEIGVPFSDPLADGPTIQRAGWRALQNGMTLRLALEQTRDARDRGLTIPLAAMTYINPVLAFGARDFAAHATEAGLDGVIVPDLPDDEADDLRATLGDAGLALIPLVAPTTPRDRLRRITSHAGGFVYCVSVTGVTGARRSVPTEALTLLQDVARVSSLPRALGFGLSRHEHLQALRGQADAAVVGSALIDAIDRDSGDAAGTVRRFCAALLGRG